MEVMVMVSNPEDFPRWPQSAKIDRYERVLEWHEYIRNLHAEGKAPQVWGSHQLLGPTKMTTTLGLHLAVYNVDSWREFDQLFAEDPLRDVSRYTVTPLSTLFEDRDADTARFEKVRAELLENTSPSIKSGFESYRANYRNAPDYVGKYRATEPENPPTDLDHEEGPDDPLEILIYGQNPAELIGQWDDRRKFVHYEKVQWWHDYTARMQAEGKLSHVWGTHDFCQIDSLSAKSAAAASVFRVKDFDEFDEIYKLDPIRDATLFWSVLLQPLASQRKIDEKQLELARKRKTR